MLTQKLYKNGNSVAVTIPKDYLEQLNLSEGKLVTVERRGQELVVAPKETGGVGVDQKFAKMVDEFTRDHEDVLQELSQK